MIIYQAHRLFGFPVFFRLEGSALPAQILPAMLGATQAVLWHFVQDYTGSKLSEDVIVHPAAYFSGLSFVLSFMLVYRSRLSYSLYWEGRSYIATQMSKLNDLIMQMKCFIQKDSPEAATFKRVQGKRLIALQYCFIQRLRGDPKLEVLLERDIITRAEYERLLPEPNPGLVLMSWFLDEVVVYEQKYHFEASPPVLSRTFQFISDAMVAYNGARKLRETPFPFPYVQVINLLLLAYLFTGPLVIAAFIPSRIFAPTVTFLVCWAFFASNAIAEEIENPFNDRPNDLPLTHFQEETENDCFGMRLLSEADFLEQLSDIAENDDSSGSLEGSRTSLGDYRGVSGGEQSSSSSILPRKGGGKGSYKKLESGDAGGERANSKDSANGNEVADVDTERGRLWRLINAEGSSRTVASTPRLHVVVPDGEFNDGTPDSPTAEPVGLGELHTQATDSISASEAPTRWRSLSPFRGTRRSLIKGQSDPVGGRRSEPQSPQLGRSSSPRMSPQSPSSSSSFKARRSVVRTKSINISAMLKESEGSVKGKFMNMA